MDSVVRGRRLLLTRFATRFAILGGGILGGGTSVGVAALGACVVACGAKQSGEPVGVSTASHGVGHGASSDGGLHGDAGLPADFRSSFPRVNKARFVSNGHAAGRYTADVYANARTDGPVGSELALGARFVEEHFERLADGGSAPGPIMMLEKMPRGFDAQHGDFRYVVITSSGEVVLDGTSESCAGCHDDAPRDHVFAVPDGG